MKEPRLQVYFVALLYFLLFISISLPIYVAISKNTQAWHYYLTAYLVLGIVYLWLILSMLFIQEFQEVILKRRSNYKEYGGELISVLVPCFNENPALLTKSIKSVYEAKGNKEIIIVDDGSTNDIRRILYQLERKSKIKVHYLLINKGKRHAIHKAVQKISPLSKYVVTIDSDTILDENTLVNLVTPLSDESIGAVSGDVKLLNEKTNILTRAIGAYYWTALHIHRKSQSSLGMVSCCSGCCAAYRTEIMRDIMGDFINQTFLGAKTNYSDDRHLTNLVLKKKYRVVFAQDAISYTYSPSAIRPFLRQQLRWRRGFIQEATYALTFTWRTQPLLFIQLLVWDLTLPFLFFALVVISILTILIHPALLFTVFLPSMVIYSLIRNMPLLFHARSKIIGVLFFSMIYEFILYWQSMYALFTLKNKKWVTR